MKHAAARQTPDARAAVLLRHKQEWEQQQTLLSEALDCGDADKARLAKLAAETLKIRQEGERRAWGIKEAPEEACCVTDVSVVVDLSHADSEQIAALVDAAYSEAEHGSATR